MSIRSIVGSAVVAATALSFAPAAMAEEITVKLWSRADRAGPLRAGNIVAAAETLNAMLKASGSEKSVKVELIETNAKGFDADALDLLKAHSVGEAPDIAVAAHEWIGSFVEAGFAANMEEHIASVPDLYADMIPSLWTSVSYKGNRYGVPQDSEVRMFFYNNDKLRALGKSEEFIAGLPAAVNSGEFTLYDLCDVAGEAVEKGIAEQGLLHRPNIGPDFQMLMASFGIEMYNQEQAKLQISKSKLTEYYGWLRYCVEKKAIPADITSWDWSSVHDAFRGKKTALIKFHGIWHGNNQIKAFGLELDDKDGYFDKITWTNAPAAAKGGSPSNMSHPIVYVVNEQSDQKELAAMLVALASQPVPNTRHAVTTNHTPITFGQTAMPDFVEKGWLQIAGTPLLKYAQFMPNHSKIGQYNSITFQGVQAVETGEMGPQEAAEFVIEELEAELSDDVIILD
ncbi:maltose ABC transporter periplasmic protein [Pseudovibrio axinellae]|uniref:Maltose ABC transporter periplasmic protein n=1 Tax=Pseudovibrio axinellae TaxID=989403 RepID=A0A165Y312_9HYPH|nr:extracellular solute-binding protein [Pseudovibrio axinellae]KZL18387.1 maltose ABC transporter periplasmic protein [Pseudovibrio axinellae]SER70707.1 inositol-phosphate transport system substrate-binding protein [Pseudovibrio axinellae]